jgi:multidrug resistance efflux pump
MSYVVSRNALVKGAITNVGSQLQGVVASVEVQPGQRAKSGDVLARFEDHQLRVTVLRAQSRVAEATARAASARARVTGAHVQATEAEVRSKNFQVLAERGVVAKDEARLSETQRRTAEALESTAIADAHAASAEVAAAQAELTLARADLDAAVIRAPADGWVVRRIAEPGAAVVVGEPVVSLWIGNEVWVEAWVDEQRLSDVAIGNPVRVTVKSFPKRVFSGVVEAIGVSTDFELPPEAVPQSRNERMRATPVVCVRAKLDQTDGLFPGLSAVVGIRRKAGS